MSLVILFLLLFFFLTQPVWQMWGKFFLWLERVIAQRAGCLIRMMSHSPQGCLWPLAGPLRWAGAPSSVGWSNEHIVMNDFPP